MVKFTKMQGCGNDYIYINEDEEIIMDKSEFTKKVSDRNFGIGSDGCIFIKKVEDADIAFSIYNPDGSEANNIKVNMGIPVFNTKEIGIKYPKDVLINERVKVLDMEYYITSLSVGNLHTVIFVDSVDNIDIQKYGKAIENLEIFEDRTNVEFVEIIDRENIKIRVWERGVGETLACGTGATASVIAGFLNGVTENICRVKLKGGILEISYNEISNELNMIGTAEFVYEGMLY